MVLQGSVYLVRHGHDKSDGSGELSGAGIEDARRARDELLARGLGSKALILTSLATRARQTAEIIGAGLGVNVMEASVEFTRISNVPAGLKSLDDLLAAEVAAIGARPGSPISELVVVTHTPLIAGVLGLDISQGSNGQVRHGSVTRYELGTWDISNQPSMQQ